MVYDLISYRELSRMDLKTIKAAVLNGQTVCWSTTAYVVKYNERGGFNIVYTPDGNCIGLTHKDGVTLNGKESEFFFPIHDCLN